MMVTCPECRRFQALTWNAVLKHMMGCKWRP